MPSLELVKSVDVKRFQGDKNVPLYSGMDFLPDGRLVLVDNLNKKLKIMNENLEIIGTFKFSNYPFDVAVKTNDVVAVTTGPDFSIEILRVDKTNTVTLTCYIKTTILCFCISFMNGETFLVSTFNKVRPLRMVTLSGHEKDFKHLGKKQHAIVDSSSTYLRNSDTLVLTDSEQNTVSMYDNNDDGKTEYMYVVKDPSIQTPRGVCEGPNGSLFVCCGGSHSLVQISSSGQVLGSHVLDMDCPVAVCMSRDGKKLVVSDGGSLNKRLQLFNIQGK